MNPNDSGSRANGSPQPMKSILPAALASIPKPSPTPTGFGGARARADEKRAVPRDGQPPGADGAVATQSAEVEARRRTVARQIGLPEAAASLVPLLGSALAITARDVYAGRELDGFEYSATIKGDAQAVDAARRALAPWLVLISIDDALAMLAELAAITKRREGDDMGDEVTMAAYARRVAEYPRDAVESVLGNWGGVFWPAWAELQAHLDRKVRARRVFARALGL